MYDARWSDELLTGVELIDRHNRHLFDLILQTQEVLVEDPHHVSGCNLIDEIIDYVFYHFASEEIWMRRRRFDRLSHHIEDHLRCTALMVQMNKKCHAGSINCVEMLSGILQILVPHIASYDAEYAGVRQ